MPCLVCGSLMNPTGGICNVCDTRTCPACQRSCERCAGVVCMNHVRLYEIFRDSTGLKVWRLCDKCKMVWNIANKL